MIQPTQDTDITSSISPLFHVRDDEPCDKFITDKNVKKLAQGREPTSFVMETVRLDKQESELDGVFEAQDSELLKSLGENFPWLVKFSKVIQSAVGSRNVKLLDRLLVAYIQNISRDVNTCYTKPHRAAKLKTHISETLMFFHLYWKNIKEKVDDHNQYLDKISEILAMYIDMELKASRRGKNSASKVAAKLLTFMFIYLDNSEEQIFRVLFRVKLVTKNYSDICDPIFTKLFGGVSGGLKTVTDVTYVRYLLALKLWKRIKDDLQEKKKINDLGLAMLGQSTPLMNPELEKFIPKAPELQKNSTLWLLQPNSFDLRKACDCFIKYELNEHILSLPDSIERFKVIDGIDGVLPPTQFNIEPIDRLQQIEDRPADKFADGSQQLKKVVKLRRFKPSFPKLRPGEVVFIDLTAENEEKKQGNGKKKKKKDKKKLKWLKEVRKKSKVEKKRKITDKTWVEKAVAHSTEDNIDQEMKIRTNDRPISEDKVSESTERIESTVANDRRFDKNDCDTTCRGCKFCNSIGRAKYNDEHGGVIESSENLITSQSSPLKNAVYIEKEFYFHPDNFENGRSCENSVNRMKQESNDSRIHNSKNISESQSFFCAADKTERRATVKTMKQEPEDIIDDSTTEKNCDKMILNDSSSFNVNMEEDLNGRSAALSVVKLEPENAAKVNGAMPFKPKSRTRYKLSKTKNRESQTCVVSTTASIADFGAGDQINIISGSTSELIEPDLRSGDLNFRRGLNSSANCDAESSDKEVGINSNKLSSTSELSKSSKKESNNSYDNSHGETLHNKLQNSLIHALSLDEIIQIGRDDVDSQSEDEENKGGAVDGGANENSLKYSNSGDDESDFFQMPDVQLCDDLTSGSEIKNLITAGAKNKVDDFENIDILDSILNGDLSMEDILEEQQHLSMGSTGLDSSANMLGFFTEFFKQSETAQSGKKNCLMGQNFHLDEAAESLPEGSLGTTGILNSLLDSDLTSIDSPPSDFMYSNVQTVDPRLIRKSPTAERVVFNSEFGAASDFISQNEQSPVENCSPVDSLSKKTKDQLFLDKKDSLNCTDLEEFGLNNAKETSFEMPVLEEELIQLSQHPLIDETMITQISPRACESSLSTSSDTENLNTTESTTSPDLNGPRFSTENNYEYSELNHLFNIKDVAQNPVTEIRPGEELPTSTLTDFTPPQSVDPPQSPYTFALSPASMYSQTVPHSPTHSIGTLRHPLSANILTPPPSMPQLMRQNNLTPPPTPQQGGNSIGENQGGQRSRVQYSPIKSQFLSSSGIEDDVVSSVQNEECYETGQQKSRPKVTYIVRSKKNVKTREVGTLNADHSDREESLRLAQVQVALTRLTAEQINARASGEQSLLKSQIFVKREADTLSNLALQKPQLQCIDLRKFGIATQPNKSVLINLNGNTKPALVFERNSQSEKLLKNFHDNVATRANVVYKLTSNLNPATSKGKPYSKIPKVNSKQTSKSEPGLFVEVASQSSVTTRCNPRNKISEDKIKKVMRPRTSTRCVKAQASKSTKELNVRQTLAVPNSEEPSMKKRKITSKVMPLLEKEGISYNVNQQKAQEKRSNVIRREFTRKDRTRKKVV